MESREAPQSSVCAGAAVWRASSRLLRFWDEGGEGADLQGGLDVDDSQLGEYTFGFSAVRSGVVEQTAMREREGALERGRGVIHGHRDEDPRGIRIAVGQGEPGLLTQQPRAA